MPEVGPGARLMIDGLAAAQIFQRPEAAKRAMRALSKGACVSDLVDPPARAECDALLTAITARTQVAFAAWAARHGAPTTEVERAIAAFEVGAHARVAVALQRLRSADDGEATIVQLVLDSVDLDPTLTDDVIVRDVGRAFLKVAQAATRDYASALARLPTRHVMPEPQA